MNAFRMCAPLVLSAGLILAGSAGCATPASIAEPGADPGIVVVQVPTSAFDARSIGLVDPDARFPPGSRVVFVDRTNLERTPLVLSDGFAAAGAPTVSPDGRRVLFAARATAADSWSVYETSLERIRPRRVLERENGCTDPAYLGNERFVACCRDVGPAGELVWSLYTTDLDGSAPRRITFGTRDAFGPTSLTDGRILFSMRQGRGRGRPDDETTALFTVNPDGTLLDAFAGSHEPAAKFNARQVDDNTVVFVERTAEEPPRLGRIDFQRPHRGATPLLPTALAGESVSGVATVEPVPGGDLLVAAGRGAAAFAIYRWAQSAAVLEDVFDEPGWAEIAAVPVLRREPPRGRPSAIDLTASTGTLVCYDSAHGDGVVGPTRQGAQPASVNVQVATAGGGGRTLGELPVAPDGSFFAELPADMPLRVVTLDGGGRTIATSEWFWIRPGERRACFGCHEARDAAPVNRTIAALAGEPTLVSPEEGIAP